QRDPGAGAGRRERRGDPGRASAHDRDVTVHPRRVAESGRAGPRAGSLRTLKAGRIRADDSCAPPVCRRQAVPSHGPHAAADLSFARRRMDHLTPQPRRAFALPGIASIGVGLIAGSVIVGWITHDSALIMGLPGAFGMNPVTAVCLLLMSASLWILAPGTPHRLAGAGRVTAGLVALVGFARILADFGLVPFTLDRFTYWNPIAQLTVTSRVAMNTAIA